MAAGCCFLWCMRYNPSQATRLLLDPLIPVSSAKMMTVIGGFVHSGSGKSRHLLLNVLLDTSCHCLFPEVRISSVNHLLPPACPTTEHSNRHFELDREDNLDQQSLPPQDDR